MVDGISPHSPQAQFGLREFEPEQGRIIIAAPSFDFDSFPPLGEQLVRLLSATVIEKQWDADLHSWLIDFEGCQMLLKAEHYSENLWLEALVIDQSQDEMAFLAQLFQRGF
ncbi:DUF3630 family protein [Vibrio sp.]|uniref:DUF3630 family protein n=1 Tax=Vibrio sp. TaxID=678 RepID=UPI003D0BD17A